MARVTSEAEESRLTSKYESALLFIRDGRRREAVKELSGILEHPMMAEAPTHLVKDDDEVWNENNNEKVVVGAEGGGRSKKPPDVVVSLTPTMTQVKFLSLKNLGRLVADMASEREAAATTASATDVAMTTATKNLHHRGAVVAVAAAADKTTSSSSAAEAAAAAAAAEVEEEEDEEDSPLAEDYALALRCYAAAVEIDGTDASLWRRLGGLAARRGLMHVARHALEQGLAIHPRHPLVLEDLAEVLLAVGMGPSNSHSLFRLFVTV